MTLLSTTWSDHAHRPLYKHLQSSDAWVSFTDQACCSGPAVSLGAAQGRRAGAKKKSHCSGGD